MSKPLTIQMFFEATEDEYKTIPETPRDFYCVVRFSREAALKKPDTDDVFYQEMRGFVFTAHQEYLKWQKRILREKKREQT